MRLAVYGTVSTLAASGVILSAFAQRANFYSATVYLAQSNACLMILTNFLLLCLLILARILQQILYGPLRDLEVESLYEKAWYAVTETCLAMTIFRDEWNVGFVLCFAGLLFAKGFCWLSSGRVEMMEQTPPLNPRLFHTRVVASLLLLISTDIAMIYYAVSDVLESGKPGMMVMFAFEFTILLITALSTAGRYGLIMSEKLIVRKQVNARRLMRQVERDTAAAQALDGGAPMAQPQAEGEDEEEEAEFVWEEKGTWMFYLELGTDFMKLLTYLAFFFIVLTFYGLPLHIIRDVYLTLRSFISRIRDFIRYRRATNDMNTRYPDAAADEVERENVCIICREEMRPYVPVEENQGVRQGVYVAAQAQQRQRMRPKKLPCGHILHFACLRSWLERQQSCPTCRRPVLEAPPDAPDVNVQGGAAPQQGGRRGGAGIAWGGQFGGIRVNFGVGQGPEFIQNIVPQLVNRPPQQANAPLGEPAPQGGQQDTTPQQYENQQGGSIGGTDAFAAPQPAENSGTLGLGNLRRLHIQLIELERRLRRELQAVGEVNMTIGNTRDLGSRLSQARQQQQQQQQLVTEASTGLPGTATGQAEPRAPTSIENPHTVSSLETVPSVIHGIHVPPGWNIIPLTPVGVSARISPASSVLPRSPGASVSIPTTTLPHRSAVGAVPTTLEDLRRRRIGRGDRRSFSSNSMDYRAIRSPGLERSQSEGRLGDNSASTDLQRRFRAVVQDSLALNESIELMHYAARELEFAPSHPGITDLVDSSGISEEYVNRAEREMNTAYENRAAVLSLAHRFLDESQQLLGQRRVMLDAVNTTVQTPQDDHFTNSNIPPDFLASLQPGMTTSQSATSNSIELATSPTSPTSPQEPTSHLSSGEDRLVTKDKGKGRAVTVESDSEDL